MPFQCCGIASDGGARVVACLRVISRSDEGLTLETFDLYQLFFLPNVVVSYKQHYTRKKLASLKYTFP